MKRNEEERQLTKAEMEIMNVLWERGEGMTTHEIIEEYPELNGLCNNCRRVLRDAVLYLSCLRVSAGNQRAF